MGCKEKNQSSTLGDGRVLLRGSVKVCLNDFRNCRGFNKKTCMKLNSQTIKLTGLNEFGSKFPSLFNRAFLLALFKLQATSFEY